MARPSNKRLYYAFMVDPAHPDRNGARPPGFAGGPDPPASASRRVLIVRPSALGDVSRTVPALVTLRRAMPEAHIDWLVACPFNDVVRHHPMLDGIVSFARDRLVSFGLKPTATREGVKLFRQLRHGRYDIVYDLQGLFRSGMLTWLTGAPRRVGFTDAREGGWLGCNVRHRVEAFHTVDRMLGLLEAEGFEPAREMRLYTGAEEQRWLAQFRQDAGIAGEQYTCIAPTARWRCKCWPIERYAELAKRLLDTGAGGTHLILLAAPHEHPQLVPLIDALSPSQRRRVHTPTTSVGQMMALLSRARLLVCNDSAALHIAIGLHRPAVGVFGPTDPARVGPYQRPETVVQPPHVTAREMRRYRRYRKDQSLIGRVSLEQVWEVVLAQLGLCGQHEPAEQHC